MTPQNAARLAPIMTSPYQLFPLRSTLQSKLSHSLTSEQILITARTIQTMPTTQTVSSMARKQSYLPQSVLESEEEMTREKATWK